jgi:flagellar biosynthetic protein FliS
MNPTELFYRKTAADGASGFGLLIALFDTLAGNLQQAAEAQRNGDLEKRCSEVNHALLVIGHLENWVNHGAGGELAQQFISFYASLRHKLFEAQARQSPNLLCEQVTAILKIREIWQQMDVRAGIPNHENLSQSSSYVTGPYGGAMNRMQGDWSA